MSLAFPEPTRPAASRAEVLERYLDYFRARLAETIADLPPEELRSSRLPSGWTPVELLKHLTHVERRWLVWGFEGEQLDDPWADSKDGHWHVGADETLPHLLDAFDAQVARSRQIVAAHDLDELGQPGERWDGAPPATLERVLLHLLQEYARHLGHLDIVAELAGGRVGE